MILGPEWRAAGAGEHGELPGPRRSMRVEVDRSRPRTTSIRTRSDLVSPMTMSHDLRTVPPLQTLSWRSLCLVFLLALGLLINPSSASADEPTAGSFYPLGSIFTGPCQPSSNAFIEGPWEDGTTYVFEYTFSVITGPAGSIYSHAPGRVASNPTALAGSSPSGPCTVGGTGEATVEGAYVLRVFDVTETWTYRVGSSGTPQCWCWWSTTENRVESQTHYYVIGCALANLSGAAWADRFPTSVALGDLQDGFENNVRAFIASMQAGNINVNVLATLRPRQRAYMMHYSFRLGNDNPDDDIAPGAIPPFIPAAGEAPLPICWEHRSYPDGLVDLAASRAAARELMQAFRILPNLAVPPALNSRHTEGLAIDMTTTWVRNTRIRDANNRQVQLRGLPRDGNNATLQQVGGTFGVVHSVLGAGDMNHWSNDGL